MPQNVLALPHTAARRNHTKKLFVLRRLPLLRGGTDGSCVRSLLRRSTVVTTADSGHTVVQIEPEHCAKIRTYVSSSAPTAECVKLEAVPYDRGSFAYEDRYIYSGDRVMLIDPAPAPSGRPQ